MGHVWFHPKAPVTVIISTTWQILKKEVKYYDKILVLRGYKNV
jgi:hypothetical protein